MNQLDAEQIKVPLERALPGDTKSLLQPEAGATVRDRIKYFGLGGTPNTEDAVNKWLTEQPAGTEIVAIRFEYAAAPFAFAWVHYRLPA